MAMHLELDTDQGIPFLHIAPDGQTGGPIVFYVPGFGSTRDSGLSLGYQLAHAGISLVAIDPIHHGARADGEIERLAAGVEFPAETGLDVLALFFRTILQAVDDIDTLLPRLTERTGATRFGVTGPSMGGYATYLALADIPRIEAAAALIGVPSFARRWTDIVEECVFSNPEWAEALAHLQPAIDAHTAFVRAIDPGPRLGDAAPRALLMINNDFDSDQPKHYAIDAYRTLRAAWASTPERLRLRIVPAGHTVTPEMERQTVDWFRTHLLAPAS